MKCRFKYTNFTQKRLFTQWTNLRLISIIAFYYGITLARGINAIRMKQSGLFIYSTSTHLRTPSCIHLCVHVCMYARTWVRIHVRKYASIYICKRLYTCEYVHIYKYLYKYVRTLLNDVTGRDSATSRSSSVLSRPLGSSATPNPSAMPTMRQLSP